MKTIVSTKDVLSALSTRIRISTVLLLAVALLAACGPQEVEKPPDQISVRLKWLHSAQFAGLYVADQKGFYAEENIEVTLNAGGPEHDEIGLVASGEDDFGIVDAKNALVFRAQGQPLVICAVVYRISPSVFFALQESGIKHPRDFLGKRALAHPQDARLVAMMGKLGLDMSQIEFLSRSEYKLEDLFAGKVDIWSGYLTDEVITAREQGYELNLIYPDDYGVHMYGDVIITTESMVKENPDLVERFLRATLRGWRYAIENADEAAAMTLQYDETLDQARQKAVLEASAPLIHTGEDHIGWMRAEVWQGMHDILLEQEVLDEPVELDGLYTMEFLQKIYGGE